MLLLLASHTSVAAYAAHRAITSAPLQGLTDTLQDWGYDAGDALRGLWPQSWSNLTIGNLSISELVEALLLLLLALVLRWLVVEALLWLGRTMRARRLAQLHFRITDLLFRTLNYTFFMVGLFAAISVLELPEHPFDWQLGAWRAWLTLLLCYSAFIAYRLSYALLRNLFKSWTARDLGLLDHGTFPLMRDLLRVAMLILAVILIIEVWGYNATALLAGVGLGGLAVAFAAQDTIANVFGSVIIYLDRPFKVGDWIKLGDVEGSVEEIGIRSTRLRKTDKTIVLVPNKRVATENIVNFNLMTSRRIKQVLCLDINNAPDKLEAALGLIRTTLMAEMQARHGDSGWEDPARLKDDFWYAHLTAVTPAYYEVTLVVFTVSTDYLGFQALQEELLMGILRGLAEQGIALAQLPMSAAQPVPLTKQQF